MAQADTSAPISQQAVLKAVQDQQQGHVLLIAKYMAQHDLPTEFIDEYDSFIGEGIIDTQGFQINESLAILISAHKVGGYLYVIDRHNHLIFQEKNLALGATIKKVHSNVLTPVTLLTMELNGGSGTGVGSTEFRIYAIDQQNVKLVHEDPHSSSYDMGSCAYAYESTTQYKLRLTPEHKWQLLETNQRQEASCPEDDEECCAMGVEKMDKNIETNKTYILNDIATGFKDVIPEDINT